MKAITTGIRARILVATVLTPSGLRLSKRT